jgi:hypothetical protein
MVLHRSIRVSALALAAVLSLSPVFAQAASYHHRYHRHHYTHNAVPPYGYNAIAPQYGAGSRTACIPWCQSDFSPCDPVYFKQADGRCEGEIW